jgi:DNA-binding transcriptional MerR regulator
VVHVTGTRISELAGAVGVAPSTVRYYERIGLVPEPDRTASGYRVYGADAEARLRFIVRGKALGLTLAQVRELLGVWDGTNCAPTQEHLLRLLAEKQTEVSAHIEELRRFSEQLREVQDQLGSTPAPDTCSPELNCCAPAIADTATEATPIACTLDSDAMANRMTEFAQLFGDALVGREPTPDGIRFRFAAGPGVEDQIRDLARREQTCCSFFSFAIEVHDDEVWWDATVTSEDARPVLDDFYALPERLAATGR